MQDRAYARAAARRSSSLSPAWYAWARAEASFDARAGLRVAPGAQLRVLAPSGFRILAESGYVLFRPQWPLATARCVVFVPGRAVELTRAGPGEFVGGGVSLVRAASGGWGLAANASGRDGGPFPPLSYTSSSSSGSS